jgi:hypothetical protein
MPLTFFFFASTRSLELSYYEAGKIEASLIAATIHDFVDNFNAFHIPEKKK